jgi:hypothetical protein
MENPSSDKGSKLGQRRLKIAAAAAQLQNRVERDNAAAATDANQEVQVMFLPMQALSNAAGSGISIAASRGERIRQSQMSGGAIATSIASRDAAATSGSLDQFIWFQDLSISAY